MAADIQPGVRERAESPTAGEEVSLLVGTEPDLQDVVEDAIADIGGKIEDSLHYNTLVVTIDEAHLDQLLEVAGITTVEIEGIWEPMDSGNFHSPHGSVR